MIYNPIYHLAKLARLRLRRYGKAIAICINGAWSMGNSAISFVHVPEHVYTDMFKDLIKLNKANNKLVKKFMEFSLKDDEKFERKLNKNSDKAKEEKIEPLPGIGNKINYELLKNQAELIKGGIFHTYMTNIRPSPDTFYKGLAAYMLMKEEIASINYNQFVGRKHFLEMFIQVRNII